MLKFCTQCGAQLLQTSATFCPACGASLVDDDSPPVDESSPHLLVQEPGQAVRTVTVSGTTVTVGRDPTNDVVVTAPAVSRHHLKLEYKGETYYISDLNSTNGTLLNGKLIAPQARQALHDGDIVRVGDPQGNWVSLTLQRTATASVGGGTVHLGRSSLEQSEAVTIGRNPANRIHLDHPTVSRQHATVEKRAQGHVLRDLDSLSGTFVNGVAVRGERPLTSGDVVYIGPFKLVYDQEAGLSQFTADGNYRLDAVGLRRAVTVRNGLSLPGQAATNGHVREKIILNDVNLSIYPREFVALVGGSGAGKSTLMKALSGFIPAQGRVLVNGDDLYTNFGAYRSILGYVPQDDIIHGQLTVRSALTYTAELRLPDASPEEIQKRIADVLAQVEMTEHADKQVNQLSGGQRKRVSIAAELLAEPGLFFLDEPTSGLDPGLEKKMMYTLRRLADGGRTIVLVTHATANIEQCTHVAFMADGHLVYFGPPQEALTFFGAQDFSDIYTRLSQAIDPKQNPLPTDCAATADGAPPRSSAAAWDHCFRASAPYAEHVHKRLQTVGTGSQPLVPPASTTPPRVAALQQFWVLARRNFELIYRDPFSLFILLAVMPLIGLLLLLMVNRDDLVGKNLGTVTREIQQSIDEQRSADDPRVDDETFQSSYVLAGSAQKLLFMMGLVATLLGIFAAAYEIVKEETIYARERMVNLQIAPYLLSKVGVLALFALVQCALFLFVIRLRVTYPEDGVFLPPLLEMFVTLFLAMLAGICLGLFISSTARSTNSVIYIVLVTLIIQILFAGAIFDLPAVARPISYLTTTRWALEALGSTANMERLRDRGVSCIEFEDERSQAMVQDTEVPCEEGQLQQRPDYTFNVSYDHSSLHLVSRWLMLLLFAGGWWALTYRAQVRKDVI